MDSQSLQAILEKGLAFLQRRQMASGRFPIEVTFHYLDGSRPVQQDDALFATAMIVYSLGFISRSAAKHMTECALTYFQTEMTGRGLWRLTTGLCLEALARVRYGSSLSTGKTAS